MCVKIVRCFVQLSVTSDECNFFYMDNEISAKTANKKTFYNSTTDNC